MAETQEKPKGINLAVGAQYIKDLSFENSHFLKHIQSPPAQPETDVKFDVQSTPLEDGKTEVVLRLVGTVKSQDKPIYILDLSYAGLFILSGATQSMAEDIFMVECPRILFPFVRGIVTNITQDSGFPPLYLAPAIDFASIWHQKKSKKTDAPEKGA
ncbi:protein-export chaperone SecB [Candidatus Hepatobacter penaei]|uniref:protein-export chaperone SecB n=1 Tax=Candidatus Hepatobacter penaei TaxID=1274402 RepID=UPI0004F2D738|nr:protein-export chaperone SecB [Candidatus Hepatobacter penaei]